MLVRKGKIKDFRGSWMSGLAELMVEDSETGELESVPCENAATVRALESCFGGIIQDDHCASVESVEGVEIYWSLDEFGLILEAFTPVEDASPELVEYYEKERKGVS